MLYMTGLWLVQVCLAVLGTVLLCLMAGMILGLLFLAGLAAMTRRK